MLVNRSPLIRAEDMTAPTISATPKKALDQRATSRHDNALSLHETLDVDLAGGHVRGPHSPNLAGVHPRIGRCRRGETHVLEKVQDRLALTRRTDAISGEGDPVAVVCLDRRPNVEINPAIRAHSKIIDAPHSPRQAALCGPLERSVESGSLRRDLLLAGHDGLQAYAIIRHACEIEIVLVNLLAPHWPNLSDSPGLATFSPSTTEGPSRKMANRSGDVQWGILPSEWRMQPSSAPARAITLAFRRTEVPPMRCRVGLHGLTDKH